VDTFKLNLKDPLENKRLGIHSAKNNVQLVEDNDDSSTPVTIATNVENPDDIEISKVNSDL
jgi:hypothetical protein